MFITVVATLDWRARSVGAAAHIPPAAAVNSIIVLLVVTRSVRTTVGSVTTAVLGVVIAVHGVSTLRVVPWRVAAGRP